MNILKILRHEDIKDSEIWRFADIRISKRLMYEDIEDSSFFKIERYEDIEYMITILFFKTNMVSIWVNSEFSSGILNISLNSFITIFVYISY